MTDNPPHSTHSAQPESVGESADRTAGPTRRAAITSLGGAALGLAAVSLAAPAVAQATSEAARSGTAQSSSTALAAACVLTPEQTQGPY